MKFFQFSSLRFALALRLQHKRATFLFSACVVRLFPATLISSFMAGYRCRRRSCSCSRSRTKCFLLRGKSCHDVAAVPAAAAVAIVVAAAVVSLLISGTMQNCQHLRVFFNLHAHTHTHTEENHTFAMAENSRRASHFPLQIDSLSCFTLIVLLLSHTSKGKCPVN